MFDRHFNVWPEHAPRHARLPQTSIYTNLEISALRYPDKTAVDYYGTSLSYGELKRQADALGGYLQSLGVASGDRVLLYMQNSPQFIIGFYAILRINAVVVPVNAMNRAAELEYLVADTDATVALCGQEVLPHLTRLLQRGNLKQAVVAAYADYVTEPTNLTLPEVVAEPRQGLSQPRATLWADALAAELAPGPLMVGPDDLCAIPYSSGTTGNPKGCMHSHRSVMATAVNSCTWAQMGSEAVQLVTVPMFHVTGCLLYTFSEPTRH